MSSSRRVLLLLVAALLTVSALLAVGILLFGRFGGTEARVLGTTAILAGYAVLCIPAAMLVDRGRAPALAAVVVAVAATATVVALVDVWVHRPPDALGKSVGTITLALLVATQTAALVARRADRDPQVVGRLFVASAALAASAATLCSVLVWTDGAGGAATARVLASLVVLDLLAVALQPILARTRPSAAPTRLRLRLESGDTVELTVAAADLATAAGRAIREVEHEGRRVHDLEVVERPQELVR